MNPKQCPVNFVCLNTTTEHSLCRPLDTSAFPVGASCTKDVECFNGGKCTNKGVCECSSPFEGDRCQDINPCRDPMTCSGKGRCERLSSSNAKVTIISEDMKYIKQTNEQTCMAEICFLYIWDNKHFSFFFQVRIVNMNYYRTKMKVSTSSRFLSSALFPSGTHCPRI